MSLWPFKYLDPGYWRLRKALNAVEKRLLKMSKDEFMELIEKNANDDTTKILDEAGFFDVKESKK